MAARSRFARLVFLIAGIMGVIVLVPQYFMEAAIGRDQPPPIAHPEHFYGFIGIALALQVVFFVIASDVRRYRWMMLPAISEKLAFGVPALLLYFSDRTAGAFALAGTIDLMLGVLFALAFYATADKTDGGSLA